MSNNPPVFRRQFLEVAKIMDDHLAYMLAQVPLPDYEAHRPVALIRREIERKPIGRVVLVCENWGLLVNDPVRSFLLCLADEHLDKFKVLLLANSKSAGSDN